MKNFRHLSILIVVLAMSFSPGTSYAQRTDQEIARDTITSWIYYNNVLKSKTYKPVTANGFTYSVWQQQVTDSLQKWVQQSYLPRAAAFRIEKGPGSGYQSIAPFQAYGVTYMLYPVSYSSKTKKLDVGGEASDALEVIVNEPIGIYIKEFNPGGTYFFYNNPEYKSSTETDKQGKTGIGINPNISSYISHRAYDNNFWYEQVIVLAKDNKLPFNPVTVGEFISYIELFLKSNSTYNTAEIKQKIVDAKKALAGYMNEPVRFRDNSIQDALIINPEFIINGIERNLNKGYQLLSVNQSVVNLTKQDKPQWLYIRIRRTRDDIARMYMAESILNNFNFDYVYNYFFYPEKVKGKFYKPINQPTKSAMNKTVEGTKSAKSQEMKNNASCLLFEDFSGYQHGKEPTGWYSNNMMSSKQGVGATVEDPMSNNHNWLKMIERKVIITNKLTQKLPANFTISFDLYCTPDYTFGSSGASFFLSTISNNSQFAGANFYVENLGFNNQATLSVKLKPAFGSNDNFEYSFCAKDGKIVNGYAQVSSFNSKQGHTTAHVEISVSGTAINILVNGTSVLKKKDFIPPDTSFSTFGWALKSSMMEDTDAFYLSNINIMKN